MPDPTRLLALADGPVRVSDMEARCLKALAALSRPDGEMCRPFCVVEGETGLSRRDVRRSIRALARKGLAEFHSGLCNEDGGFAGSGYCVTGAALRALAKEASDAG